MATVGFGTSERWLNSLRCPRPRTQVHEHRTRQNRLSREGEFRLQYDSMKGPENLPCGSRLGLGPLGFDFGLGLESVERFDAVPGSRVVNQADSSIHRA